MKNAKLVLTAIAGIAAGVGIGLLTAPKTGKRQRKEIMKEADKMKHVLEEAANSRLEEAKNYLDKTFQVRNKIKEEA